MFNTGKKGSKQLLNRSVEHYLTWHQSRYSYTKIPVVCKTNAKMKKNEDFLIISIISTAVNLSCVLFSNLLQCVLVTCNEIRFKSCVFQCTALFLRLFALISKNSYYLCNDELNGYE